MVGLGEGEKDWGEGGWKRSGGRSVGGDPGGEYSVHFEGSRERPPGAIRLEMAETMGGRSCIVDAITISSA